MTQGLLSAVKRQEEPLKRDCNITLPFKQMYPDLCAFNGVERFDRQCNTTIESGQHDSLCSEETVWGARTYGFTVIDLGCKSVI